MVVSIVHRKISLVVDVFVDDLGEDVGQDNDQKCWYSMTRRSRRDAGVLRA